MGVKTSGAIETLSREISCLLHTTGEGDFSTLLRFRRNDEGAGQRFCHLRREISPQSLLGMKKEAVKK